MKKRTVLQSVIILFVISIGYAQHYIPLDTLNWDIKAKAYILEHYKGKDAIYLQQGNAILKNMDFLNGTIEFDIYLTERQSFPGVYFRVVGKDEEEFYFRPHLSGKPDATQAAPAIGGITAWQLYYGPSYSFPYHYNFDDWTHVKVVVNGSRAQVYLDHAEKPQFSWTLKNPVRAGKVKIGGSFAPVHFANVTIDTTKSEIVDFNEIQREPIEGLIPKWEVSDKFEEKLLDHPENIPSIVRSRKWLGDITVEEGTAANISRKVILNDGKKGNTVFAKLEINSDKTQLKRFEFGYSDRVVVILNGKPMYWGTNGYRTRDYRYLGTVGLFDAVYLDLKKGKNTLLLAVSEDFGGWLVTGRIDEN